jgi:DnaK suppressor protein
MTSLTPQDIPRLEQRLRERREALRRDVDRARAEARTDDAITAVGEVRDPGDESAAELAASANLTMLDRDASELREVEAALQRIRGGTYGCCLECGRDIGRERLDAYPTATRDVDCERRLERQRAGGVDISPSL